MESQNLKKTAPTVATPSLVFHALDVHLKPFPVAVSFVSSIFSGGGHRETRSDRENGAEHACTDELGA